MSAILLWFRRDFRIGDHQALSAAVATGRPIIPVFIKDPLVEGLGAAAKWRLGEALKAFSKTLETYEQRLILRSGDAAEVLENLISQSGATSVYWSRSYDPQSVARDTQVKSTLKANNIDAQSFAGHLLYEPWVPKNKSGAYFKVYSPFWRHVSRELSVAKSLPPPEQIASPATFVHSDRLEDWALDQQMHRGAKIVAQHSLIGEHAAQARLSDFIQSKIANYKSDRDFPALDATSGLSEPLTYGEISPRQIQNAITTACDQTDRDVEHFLKELAWREFAYHLLWHFSKLDQKNWRAEWDGFTWESDDAILEAWRFGETGIDFVDAAMREVYVTGKMHNRLRMIVGSYLTKHLLQDWRNGLAWFQDVLTDWDPASNAMGWQWIAGCGPDAAPYFRVFNPDGQAEKFDQNSAYRHHWLSGAGAQAFYEAIPKSKVIKRPAQPIVSLADGRQRALAAYASLKDTKAQT